MSGDIPVEVGLETILCEFASRDCEVGSEIVKQPVVVVSSHAGYYYE